jgi:hypothetical protein
MKAFPFQEEREAPSKWKRLLDWFYSRGLAPLRCGRGFRARHGEHAVSNGLRDVPLESSDVGTASIGEDAEAFQLLDLAVVTPAFPEPLGP